MKTEIIRIDPVRPEPYKLEYCGAVLRYGGLVAFPTETVYGLGANAFLDNAVRKVFEAKGRPADNPLIVHVAYYASAESAGEFADGRQRNLFYALGAKFWPGPLTMIIKKRSVIPDSVSCGLDTVGIRMPSNRIAAGLLRAARVPIAAPSANSSGRPSPTRFEHVLEDMYGKVDVIIDGGECSVGVESTVLDLNGPEPTVLRPGAVTREDIARVAGTCGEYGWSSPDLHVDKPRSPGMKYRHYAPKALMLMFSGTPDAVRRAILARLRAEKTAGKRVGVLETEEQICYYNEADVLLSLGPENEPRAHAQALFAALRQFDAAGVDVIFARALEAEGVDDAVMNRMFRAAGGTVLPAEE